MDILYTIQLLSIIIHHCIKVIHRLQAKVIHIFRHILPNIWAIMSGINSYPQAAGKVIHRGFGIFGISWYT